MWQLGARQVPRFSVRVPPKAKQLATLPFVAEGEQRTRPHVRHGRGYRSSHDPRYCNIVLPDLRKTMRYAVPTLVRLIRLSLLVLVVLVALLVLLRSTCNDRSVLFMAMAPPIRKCVTPSGNTYPHFPNIRKCVCSNLVRSVRLDMLKSVFRAQRMASRGTHKCQHPGPLEECTLEQKTFTSQNCSLQGGGRGWFHNFFTLE
jgi:hypothetical protein